jgi:hypothetical protein
MARRKLWIICESVNPSPGVIAPHPTASVPRSLFNLFYQVEIRHRQLLQTTIPRPVQVAMAA